MLVQILNAVTVMERFWKESVEYKITELWDNRDIQHAATMDLLYPCIEFSNYGTTGNSTFFALLLLQNPHLHGGKKTHLSMNLDVAAEMVSLLLR